MQEGDVLLFQSENGGEIEVINGITTMTGGFETAVFLSLFGGNEKDDGTPGNKNTWWGNRLDSDPDYKYVSRTQNSLYSLIPISGNLKRLEDAILSDLDWMIQLNTAQRIVPTVALTGKRRVRITVDILADGEFVNLVYLLNWKSQSGN